MRRGLFVACAMLATACSPLMTGHPGRPIGSGWAGHHRPAAPDPEPWGRWDQVMRLQAGSLIEVLTADGARRAGEVVSATLEDVRLRIGTTEEQVSRADVIRVDLIAAADSAVRAGARTAAGHAALGAAATGVVAILLGRNDVLPPQRLIAAGAAGGAVAGVQTEILRRQPHAIYLSPALRP